MFNNHLEVFTNLGVSLATLVPIAQAPLVTTFYAIAIWLGVFAFLFSVRQRIGLTDPAFFALLLAAFGMPQAAEVWANTINLHFLFYLLATVVLILPAPKGGRALASAGVLFLLGLGGIPVNFVAPLFLLSALIEKDRGRSLQALAIGLSCAVQIWLLLSSGYGGERGLVPPFDIIALAALTQSFWALFLGEPGGTFAADQFWLLYAGQGRRVIVPLLVLCATLYGFARAFVTHVPYGRADARAWRHTMLLAAAAIGLCASVTLALGDPILLISASGGGRYFWAPSLILLVLFFSGGVRSPFKTALTAVLVVFSAIGLFHSFDGPDWRAQIEAAPGAATVSVDIWPHGWSADIPQPCISG